MMATAVELSNAWPANKLDGVNLVPYLNGEQKGEPHEALYWRKYDHKAYAIRKGDQKMVKYKSEVDEVYNLADDISESNSLELSDDNHYSALKADYEKWASELKDPIFLGLMQNKKYNQLHPERFVIVNPYKADSGEADIPEGYALTWSDEFNSEGKPNAEYWSYEKGFVRNKELQWYQADNASVANGVLTIEGRREEVHNPNYKKRSKDWRKKREKAEYTSSCIKTKNKFAFQYGIMEVRARIDTSMGLWPAIWTLGVDGAWPANGEVDQLEYYRHQGEAKILANAAWANSEMQPVWDSVKIPFAQLTGKEKDWADKFHIWKMDWTKDDIRLYLDDKLVNEIDLSKTINADGTNPFHQPQYILLNMAIGGQGGDPTNTIFPCKYEVDYVRVYQKNNKE